MRLKPGDILIAEHIGPWRKIRIVNDHESVCLEVDYSLVLADYHHREEPPFGIPYGAIHYSNTDRDWRIIGESDIVMNIVNLYS